MVMDLTIILEDRPGTLATLGETLGNAGVNIEGFCGFLCEGKGEIHILVEDAAAARSVLEASGIEVANEREVLLVPVEDRPGALGEFARKMASAGVNIDLAYLAGGNRLVIGVDDLAKGRSAM